MACHAGRPLFKSNTMKGFLYIVLLYLCVALLATGCSETTPTPACTTAMVVGQHCTTGWFVLKLQDDSDDMAKQRGEYVGQLHGGYVVTDSLPEQYRQSGQVLQVRLELNSSYGPRCYTAAMMYPAVHVVDLCGQPE